MSFTSLRSQEMPVISALNKLICSVFETTCAHLKSCDGKSNISEETELRVFDVIRYVFYFLFLILFHVLDSCTRLLVGNEKEVTFAIFQSVTYRLVSERNTLEKVGLSSLVKKKSSIDLND